MNDFTLFYSCLNKLRFEGFTFSGNTKIMKTFLIGMSLMACLYSAQNPNKSKPMLSISPSSDLEDTAVYGPQLPSYYSNSVSDYVRRVFQDRKGNLWFGTNTDGLAVYDGQRLRYITPKEGLSGSQITGIMEDNQGNLWFSTNQGVSKYNPSEKESTGGRTFQNFGEKEGLCNASIWSIFQDSKGTIWAGTLSGLCRLNGDRFESFPVPNAEKSWVRSITEDRMGNLWFATADKGAFKFDGTNFKQLSKKDGLCSNDLTTIMEDRKGTMWFGSMDGGLSQYNGKKFTNLLKGNGIGNNEVWTIYEDRNGRILFSAEGFGIYSYTYLEGTVIHFGDEQGLHIGAVQSIYQDREGRYWIGGGSGLVLFDGNQLFMPVSKNGPWNFGC